MSESPSEAITALLDRFSRLAGDQLNEANTRLLFINEVLTRVLGWSLEELNPEEPVTTGEIVRGRKTAEWLDYHLRSGDYVRLVVEAIDLRVSEVSDYQSSERSAL